MPHQVGVLEALNDYGVNYREYPGCRTRGYSSFWPLAFVEHHDAIAARWEYPPSIFADGRPPPNYLPGPITNFCNTAEGIVWVIALGAANHAGAGGWRGVSGNSKAWGLEQQNAGDDVQVYPDEQIDSTVRLTAACADFSGFDAEMVCRHAEWAPSRKIDPRGPWEDGHRWQYDMSHFRALVAQGGEDDFMATLDDKEKAALMSAVQAINGVPSFGFPPMRDLIASSQGVWIVKVKGQRAGWVTNGVQRSKVGGGLGKKLKALGVPQVEVTAAELAAIPVVSG